MKKILIISILLFVAAIVFGRYILFKDDSVVKDQDLIIKRIEIPDKENAFYYFKKASDKVYYSQESTKLIGRMIRGEEWDQDLAKKLLKKNEEMFILLKQGLACDVCQFPEPVDVESEEGLILDYVVLNINIWKVGLLKSRDLFNQGEAQKAFENIERFFKLSSMVMQGKGGIHNFLLSIMGNRLSLNQVRYLVDKSFVSADYLKKYSKRITRYKTYFQGLEDAMRSEYLSMSYMVSNLWRSVESAALKDAGFVRRIILKIQMRKKKWSLNINNTKNMFAEVYRSYLFCVGKYFKDVVNRDIMKNKKITFGSLLKSFPINPMGKVSVSLKYGLYKRIFEHVSNLDVDFVATQLILALKSYELETGSFPKELSELVPNYIGEIPKDNFDGKPIRYSLDKKIVYSVGVDLIDNEGDKEKDIVFSFQ